MNLLIVSFIIFSSVNSEYYRGHQLLRIFPEIDVHHAVLNYLRNDVLLDFWKISEEQFDILVPSSNIDYFINLMKSINCPFHVAVQDIQTEIDEEVERLKNREPGFNYDDFNKLNDIYDEIDKLASKCIPGFTCKVDSLGNSFENKPIKRLKISKGTARKAVWLDSTTHAREWLTTATLLRILKNLFDNYGNSSDVTNLLNKYDFYFVPVVNPDGYEFSWTEKRLWRKNRSFDNKTKCFGVDLNRNADFAWGSQGASNNPCSETYFGSSPASEPETQILQKILKSIGGSLVEVVSIHAYGYYWLTPYGHIDNTTQKCFVASDENDTLRVANDAANAIEKVSNTKWARGPTCTTIYPASGTIIDFAKAKACVRHTAVPEVRGNSFIVPPTQIEPSFREIWAGVVASIKAIEANI